MEKDSPICEEIIEVSSEITTFQEQSGYQNRTSGNQLQIRKEVEKVLKPYNTTSYSLLEYGAESMLYFERVYNRVQEFFSTDSIVDNLSSAFSSLGRFMNSFVVPQPNHQSSEMNDIQEKLNLVMKQMEAVQEDNRKKSEELEQLRNQISASNSRIASPKVRPVPPPFPSKLDQYSQQSEQSIVTPHTIASPVSRPGNSIPSQSPNPLSLTPSSPSSPVSSQPAISSSSVPQPVTSSSSVTQPTTSVPPIPSKSTTSPTIPSQSTPTSPKPKSIPPSLPQQIHTSSPQNRIPFQRNPNLLTEIQQAAKNVKLRKVPRNADGTPVRANTETESDSKQSVNDMVREKLIERIRMMEDEEPEEDVRWRESDIF